MSEVVDAHDVRMIEARQRPRFPDEALGECGVVLQMRMQHLDGNRPVQLSMPRLVDGTHAARTNQLEGLEFGQAATRFLG